MSTFSKAWHKQLEADIVKALRDTNHPKGSGRDHHKLRHADIFPARKPGEGGFDMTAGKGKRKSGDKGENAGGDE